MRNLPLGQKSAQFMLGLFCECVKTNRSRTEALRGTDARVNFWVGGAGVPR